MKRKGTATIVTDKGNAILFTEPIAPDKFPDATRRPWHFVRPTEIQDFRKCFPAALVAASSGVNAGEVWTVDQQGKLTIRKIEELTSDLLFF